MSHVGCFLPVTILFSSFVFCTHCRTAVTRKILPAGSGEYRGISVPMRENCFRPMLFLDVAPFDSRAPQMKTRPRTNAGDFGQIVR